MINDSKKTTENGAAGYATTGKALVDLNFAAASLRSMTEEEIIRKFIPAFYEDRILAMKWLFFLRDARGGLGERRTFRVIFRYLAESNPEMADGLIDLMAEYGRYDDLLCLFDTPLEDAALTVIKEQLRQDLINMERAAAGGRCGDDIRMSGDIPEEMSGVSVDADGKGPDGAEADRKPSGMKQTDTQERGVKNSTNVSLCAKWMPGNNTSSPESRRNAAKLQHFMGMTAGEYRKMLSSLRVYLDVTEVHMSSNHWEEIDYTRVASRANIIYRNAFLVHDPARRKDFLKKVQDDQALIHAGVLMPHEIAARYTVCSGWRMSVGAEDAALEVLWKNLPGMAADAGNVLCVVDGSGSMLCPVGDGNVTALHVSNALGIYFAERMGGAYHDRFLTFSASPKYVDLSGCRSLREKLELALANNDCSNTNIEATFELILQTAVRNHLKQRELPGTVLVISDMEFDRAVTGGHTETLFETIRRRFAAYGYRMPKLVFWNVNSRTNVIPVRENELGVGLVSGFSVNVCNMVLSNELDPFACLKKVLDSERYRKVEERLCS